MALVYENNNTKVVGSLSDLITQKYLSIDVTDSDSTYSVDPVVDGNSITNFSHQYSSVFKSNALDWVKVKIPKKQKDKSGNSIALLSIIISGKANSSFNASTDSGIGVDKKHTALIAKNFNDSYSSNIKNLTVFNTTGPSEFTNISIPNNCLNDTGTDITFHLGFLCNSRQNFTWSYTDLSFGLEYGYEIINETENGTINVSFDKTGPYSSGAIVKASANSMEGFIFDKWLINGKDGGNANPLSINITGPITLQASYALKSYSIQYKDATDNSIIKAQNYGLPENFNIRSPRFRISSISKYGYRFDGWSGHGQDNIQEFDINTGETGNRTYTANFTPIDGSITFTFKYSDTSGGGTWDLSEIENKSDFDKFLIYNIETQRNLPTPVKGGYQFANWTLNSSILENNSLPLDAYTPITLVGNFTSETKKVKVRTNIPNAGVTTVKNTETGEESINGELFVEYFADFNSLELNADYEKNDYKFIEWQLENGTSVSSNLNYNPFLSWNDDDNSYVAVFEPIIYTVEIPMECGGIPNVCGEILTNLSTATTQLKGNKVLVSNLRWKDKLKISVIPYAKDENIKYEFTNWKITGAPCILDIEIISPQWGATQISKTYTATFEEILLNQSTVDENATSGDRSDKEVTKRIIDKTITCFILKNKITSLGDYAFYGCNKLRQVIMPGASKIGVNVFQNCSDLRTVILSSSSRGSFGDLEGTTYAFENCNNLNLIILPDKFVQLNGLFREADDLEKNSPLEQQSLFRQGLGKIYVPTELLDDYKTGSNWSTYASAIFPLEEKIYKEDSL